MICRFFAAAAICAVLGTSAHAQGVATDLNQVQVLVKLGESLTVIDNTGHRARGRLTQLDASALELEFPNKDRRQFTAATIATIEKRRGDSLKNGALIGLIIGGGIGVWAGIDDAHYQQDLYGGASNYTGASAGREALGFGLFYAGVGAAIGTGIDALIHGNRVIYDATPRTTVSISPRFDHRRKGFVLTLRR